MPCSNRREYVSMQFSPIPPSPSLPIPLWISPVTGAVPWSKGGIIISAVPLLSWAPSPITSHHLTILMKWWDSTKGKVAGRGGGVPRTSGEEAGTWPSKRAMTPPVPLHQDRLPPILTAPSPLTLPHLHQLMPWRSDRSTGEPTLTTGKLLPASLSLKTRGAELYATTASNRK